MANGPSLRSNFDVRARPDQPEVISLLDDEEQDQRASAPFARPSFPLRRRRVSIPEDDDEVIILDGPPPKRKGRFISSFVDVDPPRAQRPLHLPRHRRSSPRLPSRSNSVPEHVDAVVLRPGDTRDLALSVDDGPSTQAWPSTHPRSAAAPRVVIDLIGNDSNAVASPPQQHHNAVAGPSRLPFPPPPLNPGRVLLQQPPRSQRHISRPPIPAQAPKTLQTNLILTHFPSFPTSLIPEVLDLSWSFHPSSLPNASLPLSALTPVAQRSITRSVLRSFVRHEMTRYEADLVEIEREVTRRWGGSGGRGSEAEVWKRGSHARLRKEANRVADQLLVEFEGRSGGSGGGGVGRIEYDHEGEDDDDDAWDRDEWRD